MKMENSRKQDTCMKYIGSLGVLCACLIQGLVLYALPINQAVIFIHILTALMYIIGYYIGSSEIADIACKRIREILINLRKQSKRKC